MSVEDTDPTTMTPLELARFVKRTPGKELRRIMHGERRAAILKEIFTRMPDVFRADRAGSLNAIVHWRVGDRPDGGAELYEMAIADGRCVVAEEAARVPNLTLSLGAVDFLNLVTGNAHAVGLVMRGKLKTKGDLGLTAMSPTLFEPPKA